MCARTEQVQKDYSEHGDLGLAAFHARSNQRTMFPMPSLTLATVFSSVAPEPPIYRQTVVEPGHDSCHVVADLADMQSTEHATAALQRNTIACTLVCSKRRQC